jgi:hypothetical protein
LYDSYCELIESPTNGLIFSIKSAKKIRLESQSNSELFGDSLKESLTEEYMFKRLFDHKSEFRNYYKSVYILWRYFAQFQHYSFSGRHFIAEYKEDFLYYFIQSLRDCYYFVYVLQNEIFHLTFSGFDEIVLKVCVLLEEFKPNELK